MTRVRILRSQNSGWTPCIPPPHSLCAFSAYCENCPPIGFGGE
ncbi:hypothetical protein EC1094_4774 [Escherichia coli]|nr:hypothetical protein EC1094_4774 [Escherichia coli]